MLVRIYPKEFWTIDSQGIDVTVNGHDFSQSLDATPEESEMVTYFGKIVDIEYLDSLSKFIIKDDPYEWTWNDVAIQEELDPKDYPEYTL